MSDEHPKQRIAERLAGVGVGTERFIDVKDGEKKSIDHEQRPHDDLSGNYGIYANGNDALCILDIDDYGDLDDKSGLSALAQLPATLEQRSPHGGTHRLYKVEPTDDGRLVAAALADAFGKANPGPSWGEVRVKNQYVVGAGSQLDGCDKDNCDHCAEPDGGQYAIRNDRKIATISPESLIDVLSDDPVLSKSTQETTLEDVGGRETPPAPDGPDDLSERLEHARERDDKLDRLMRGDYSDYRDSDGVDRSKAEYALAFKLAFWLGGDERDVERAMDRHATLQKWDERDDRSYRDSVLSAVDEQTEFYTPTNTEDPPSYSPEVDWEEVDRGEAILEAERGVTDPYGRLQHKEGCYGWHEQRTDDEGNNYTVFHKATNFTLELLSIIETYEGSLLNIRVHPSSPMEDHYDVQVHPTVFNSGVTFKEEIVRGRTTQFDPKGQTTSVLNDLKMTVGHQHAPEHKGTEAIGLHGDDYQEWVTPAGTLSAEGWVDEPEYKYYEKGGNQEMESSLEDKWEMLPEDGSEYDREAVKDICERVPKTRRAPRGLPILGWFYAAPLKPIVHDIEGEFNLLQVTGDTEAGKTSTLNMFYELFGADPAPFGCGDTNFTIEKKLAGSCGLPIWLDEYKPTDLSERKLDWLHRRLREVTREKTVSKGQQDLGEITFRMRAPVVFSGEQTVTEAAVRRRTVMTHLTDQATTGEYQRAFCELTGASYTDEDGEERYPMGYDLHEHARAFYRYVLQRDPEELRDAWQAAREKTRDHLRELTTADLDGTEFQGLQTIVFGVGIFRQFATEMGVEESELPSDSEVRGALDHAISNIGPEGRRREHIDEFVELMEQAASAGYLEEGVTHRVYEPQMADEEALAFHMPTTFPAVKKYVREYNLDDEYAILGKNDYVDSFSDKAEKGDSYPLATNHKVRKIENGKRAVVIEPHRAAEVLPDGFTLSAFTGQDVGEDDGGLADLSPGDMTTVTAVVAQLYVNNKDWYAEEGWLEDETGATKLIVRDELDHDLEEGKAYRFENVSIHPDDEGITAVEPVPGLTTIEEIEMGGGTTPDDGPSFPGAAETESSEESAAADGGVETEEPPEPQPDPEPPEPDPDLSGLPDQDEKGPLPDARRIRHLLREKGPMEEPSLLGHASDDFGMSPSRARQAVEKGREKGLIQEMNGELMDV